MPLDLVALGNKLQRYRKQFQASLTEVSGSTGISAERIEQFEKGELQPTGDEILILADFYKCDYKFFVSNERSAPFEETETLFRRYGDEFSKEDRWKVQEFLYLCENEEHLMQLTSFSQSRSSFSFNKEGSFAKGNARRAAIDLRMHLGYEPHELPLDIYSDFRKIGIHVFRRKLNNSNISGLFIKHPTAGKCVLVNYSEDTYRQRFTAAHEVGHAILDDDSDFVVSFAKWEKGDLREIAANVFASSYLMPLEFLLKIPDNKSWTAEKFRQWVKKLKVSPEALAIALREQRLIRDDEYSGLKSLRIPMSEKRDPELSGDLAPATVHRRSEMLRRGLSDYYVQLCFESYERALISAGKVAEFLLVDERKLPEIAVLFGRRIVHDH